MMMPHSLLPMSMLPRLARLLILLFTLIPICPFLLSQEAFLDLDRYLQANLTIDLRNPAYCEGVLRTDEGGVISGPNVRIQASHILYTRSNEGEALVCRVEASNNLILEFGEYLFIGESLEYDFITQTGVIYEGRSSMEPWFFGGKRVFLYPDSSYEIEEGYITTSQQECPEWMVSTATTTLSANKDLCAQDVQFRLFDFPVFWLPSLKINLDTIFDNPIRYSFRWGGKQGPRIGMTYEIFDWNRWKTFLRFDYRLTRGPGGGFETRYRSEDHTVCLETINYVAMDNAIIEPHEKVRYRVQGKYHNSSLGNNIYVDASWDKLSDSEMATDYNDRGLELDTAGKTQLHLRHATDYRITNFWSRVRVNNFETIKEELPNLETQWHPWSLGSSGLIFQNRASAAYLDFKYTKGLPFVHNYNSTRFEYTSSLYRPFNCTLFKVTPQIGGAVIYYGNTPHNGDKWLTFADFNVDLHTRLSGYIGTMRHVIVPYASYEYLTFPTSSPNQHYIFDIGDGWYRLNQATLGVKQNLYLNSGSGCSGCIRRAISLDIFTFGFFDTPTLQQAFPKVYGELYFFTLDNLRHILTTAWDMQRHRLDHFNIRTEWTVHSNLAIAAEYRHRDGYDWRKADHFNFILDSFRPTKELTHSALSDRRDTFLVHLFYRFHPNWALEFESRNGWNRAKQPSYTEFEADLLGTLPSAWNMKVSYQHKEEDDRVALYISIGLKKPTYSRTRCFDYY